MFNPNFKKCSTTIALNGSPSNCLMGNRGNGYSLYMYLGYAAVPITEKAEITSTFKVKKRAAASPAAKVSYTLRLARHD